MSTLGKRIKQAREKKHLTQKQLADLIGAKHNSISNWENDQNKPDVDCLEMICGELDIDVNWLLGYENKSSNMMLMSLLEQSLIQKYRPLSPESKERVDNTLNFEYELWKKGQEEPKEKEKDYHDYSYGYSAAWGGKSLKTKITREESKRASNTLHKINKMQKEKEKEME